MDRKLTQRHKKHSFQVPRTFFSPLSLPHIFSLTAHTISLSQPREVEDNINKKKHRETA